MRAYILFMIAFMLFLGACSANRHEITEPLPKPGKWLDPETNIRFTIVQKGDRIVVTEAKDMDDREDLVIVNSNYELGVLSWSYYIPSTKFTVVCRTLEYTENTIDFKWNNGILKGTETLRRVN